MEAQNQSFSEFLSNFIIYILIFVLGYIFWSMLFGEGSSRSTSAFPINDQGNKVLKDENVKARDKACVAVGLCHPERHEFLSADQLYKWKMKIMDNAEKIFTKEKTVKKKITKKKNKH